MSTELEMTQPTDKLDQRERGMSDEFPIPVLPPLATVQDIKDYMDWHIQHGRAKSIPKGRMMAFIIPPIGHDSHDDNHQEVYLNLIPE